MIVRYTNKVGKVSIEKGINNLTIESVPAAPGYVMGWTAPAVQEVFGR